MNSGNSKKYISKNRLRLLEEYDMLFTTYDNKGYAISNDDYEKFIKRIKKLNEPI
jgi:hypothetical protein